MNEPIYRILDTRGRGTRFLAHLNGVHPRIQFTIEMEMDDQLACLDVLVVKQAVIRTLVDRAKRISEHRLLDAEFRHLEEELQSATATLLRK